jgi:UDP-GlcNAc3NAcA epimerase
MSSRLKILSIVGARPEFVQAAMVSRALRKHHDEILVHTGQHYDDVMSDAFFRDLAIPEPDVNLSIAPGTQWGQIGEMLPALADTIRSADPDLVIVRGDTSSTVAGALAARQTLYPLAHVEAGMRSYDVSMPEEANRVVADHLADIQFVTDDSARKLLAREGIDRHVYVVGDVMYDTFLATTADAVNGSAADGYAPGSYDLLTIHRGENTDDRERLSRLVAAFETAPRPVVFPIHPRTRKRIAEFGIDIPSAIDVREPLGYREMLAFERNANRIYTDSGGVQREAYFAGVACVTLRDNTEWKNTVDAGWNELVGTSIDAIRRTFAEAPASSRERPPLFGNGDAADRMCAILETASVRELLASRRRLRESRS